MTRTAANQNQPRHPYLTQEMFRDPTFIRVRRRVALIMIPHSEPESRALLMRLVAIYDDLLK